MARMEVVSVDGVVDVSIIEYSLYERWKGWRNDHSEEFPKPILERVLTRARDDDKPDTCVLILCARFKNYLTQLGIETQDVTYDPAEAVYAEDLFRESTATSIKSLDDETELERKILKPMGYGDRATFNLPRGTDLQDVIGAVLRFDPLKDGRT